MEKLGSPITHICVGIFINAARPLQCDMLDGPISQTIWDRLEAINSISLISFHCATWITETACAWGNTFMQKKLLPRPEINTRPLSLSLSCFPHGHLFFNSSSNPPHSSPSAVPLFPPLTYLTVFQLMSASPSDHAPPPSSTPHCR